MRKVGDVFMLGFRGTEMPDWMKEFAREFDLGGYIIFDYDCISKARGRNVTSPEQARALLGTKLESDPLVFIDQEGGKVRRFKHEVGFKPLPSAKEMALLSVEERRRYLRDSFRELKELGVHVNLAPVIDIAYNEKGPDLAEHDRTYGNNIEAVEENARLMNEVASEVNLGLCVKHYPGHGAATKNTHDEVADISGTLTEEQLNLFYRLCTDFVGRMVLVGHGIVREWDADNPSDMAAPTIGRFRKAVPDAMIISDDIQMQGLQHFYGSEEACKRGVSAGCDMIIVGNNMMDEEADKAFALAESLVKLAEKDSDFKNRIAEASARVRRRKIDLRLDSANAESSAVQSERRPQPRV